MWSGTCRKILFFILFRPPTLFLKNKIRKTKNKISVSLTQKKDTHSLIKSD